MSAKTLKVVVLDEDAETLLYNRLLLIEGVEVSVIYSPEVLLGDKSLLTADLVILVDCDDFRVKEPGIKSVIYSMMEAGRVAQLRVVGLKPSPPQWLQDLHVGDAKTYLRKSEVGMYIRRLLAKQ